MRKKGVRLLIFGFVSMLIFVITAYFSVNTNNGRLLYPATWTSYYFKMADLPMIVGWSVLSVFFIDLAATLTVHHMATKRDFEKHGKVRRPNPGLGYLGFLGFTGFIGIFTELLYHNAAPFTLFIFFGFFGYFYEEKVSKVLSDERQRVNRREAQAKANGLGFKLQIVVLLVAMAAGMTGHAAVTAAVLTAGISLVCALTIYLTEYLVYRYDKYDVRDWRDETDFEMKDYQ